MKRDLAFHRDRASRVTEKLSSQEKLDALYGTPEDHKRLGLPYLSFAGEAAHGVQSRHDQNFDLGEPSFTTVFPNPIGMAASFDKEMMRRIGEVTGIECRSLLNEGRHNGILCLAPTVDMERDPRWGRNEEAYGEDPRLTSRMAGEYILGMAGEDPTFVRCGATLKHFYGNNVEENRFISDSRMPEDLKEDYYLRVFREVVEYASPLSAMTSYNLVNGLPSTFNPEARKVLKEQGVPYIVSDAFTVQYSVEDQKAAPDGATAVSKAMAAGIDMVIERKRFGRDAVEEALERGLITEEQLSEALIGKLTAYSLLGLMPEDLTEDGCSTAFPKSEYHMGCVDTKEARALARRAAAEAVVLLKNDGVLPLKKEETETEGVFLFGPLADRWPMDWYSGFTSKSVTVREGLGAESEALYPVVKIRLGNGKYAAIRDQQLVAVEAEEAEKFTIMLWDESRVTIRAASTGKLLSTTPPGKVFINDSNQEPEFRLFSHQDEVFSWMMNEAFQLVDADGGPVRFNAENALHFWEDPRIFAIQSFNGKMEMQFETVKDAKTLIREAAERTGLTKGSRILACYGLHPIVNCKEERDRESIVLPPYQRATLRLLREEYGNIILLLLGNAPMAVEEEADDPVIRGLLWSCLGCEELGNGIADVLYGVSAPAGRLPQTWYRNDAQLPAIDDYDIRKNGMTYLYMTEKPLFRFGFGLGYSEFRSDLTDVREDEEAKPRFTVSVENVGQYTSDHVVQVYLSPEGTYHLYGNDPEGCDKDGEKIPVGSRLVAFGRAAGVRPEETRTLFI